MRKYTFLLFVILLPLKCLSSSRVEQLLDTLDYEVARSTIYDKQKEDEIKALKTNLQNCRDAEQKWVMYNLIVQQYIKHNFDSAQHYINKSLELAKVNNREEWRKEALIDMAYLFTIRSQNQEINELLKAVGPIENLSPALQIKYTDILFLRVIIEGVLNLKTEEEYSESMKEVFEKYHHYYEPKSLQSYFATFRIAGYLPPNWRSEIEHIIEKSSPVSNERGMMYCLYSEILANIEGEEEAALEYMIRSCICDIKMSNNDSQALPYIINILIKNKEKYTNSVSRIYNYTMLCSQKVRYMKDFGRSLQLIENQAKILHDYQSMSKKQLNQLGYLLLLCLLLLAAALILFVLWYKKNAKLNKIVTEVQIVNSQLNAQLLSVQELTKKNDLQNHELEKKMELMITHLASSFKLCSKYIDNLTLLKKNIKNLLHTGMVAEAKKMAESTTLQNATINDLHLYFDKTFLSIFPDFVERFNSLLSPDAQIVQESSNELTPALRIYALVCLGIQDSVSIAQFLHYSQQTVYNYRLKIRQTAIIPKEEFAQAVANLYKETTKKIVSSTIEITE